MLLFEIHKLQVKRYKSKGVSCLKKIIKYKTQSEIILKKNMIVNQCAMNYILKLK